MNFVNSDSRFLYDESSRYCKTSFVEKFLDIIRDLLGASSSFYVPMYYVIFNDKINYISNVYFRLRKDKVC